MFGPVRGNSATPAALSLYLIFLLGLVGASMSVFSDMIIAALPVLQSALAANDRDTQQLVTLYFIATAVMALWVGALADAYGRRPLVLASMLLLTISSIACLFSERIEQLWLLRVVQGAAAGVGMILSRTIVRDLVSGVQAQKSIGQISLIQALVPILTPIIGAWTAAHYGWQAVFAVAAGLSCILLVVFYRVLAETLPAQRRTEFHPIALLDAYRTVLGSATFLRMSLAHAMNWGAMFLYIAAAPKIMLAHLGRSPAEMYQLFLFVMPPMIVGFLLLPHALHRWGAYGALKLAYGICFVAVILNLLVSAGDISSLWALTPFALYMVGVAATTALLIGAAMEPFPNNAGMASSCQMFIQFLFMGLTAGVVAPLAWGSLLNLAWAHGALVLTGFLILLWQRQATSAA